MAPLGPIALFDSGEGGLTVLRTLRQQLPQYRFLYGADSGHFPYGEKSLDDVRQWFLAFLDFFVHRGASAVVIACNTATAAALDEAKARSPVPVIGVVDPAARRAAEVTKNGKIGVLSTESTYRSRLYPRTLKALNPALMVVAKPCPILVSMAENGDTEGYHVEDKVRQCVEPVLETGVDTIILGCTHFPHMRQAFNRVVGQAAAIIDPGEEVGVALAAAHIEVAPVQSADDPITAWTTADPGRFTEIARKLCPEIPLIAEPLMWQGPSLAAPRASLLDNVPTNLG
ncbi:MAG: glutamate racemase [Firmicutes bacterium]|nr:glutamate racemase [Bacillota bacterium]